MVARAMLTRLEALEREDHGAFPGYAVLDLYDEQTLDEAKAEWIAENGPIGSRVCVIYKFGKRNPACA
jgi:hypothetical protein